ncbi:DNA polymerase III subunit gamma/tau [Thiomicrospira cyclica]|uniref:DNA polymerase III subunit gamma/tau n=1 Tax=Thiomicrospira cyclica (strain DSM 14477 / JCM 11371 / ALM1) TaxID=717773 RepID=F6D9E8_THICA|nr:DNA polymerase III subunit gamma/tau [Thiomicrospira cyclica]AEG32075.1 DNA polymerase III, subunits gamma and tau [Thiomicrospira cyclica ALM1]
MTYQVLARKWRPKNFSELVGQTHVMQALSNALEQQRVHHAYLFTGTRGVGKTTIARIFSKALNCEQGPSAHPCGQCSACLAIDQGRFVDLIEVDAASRTKVEDTREILDNVQYAPTQGRFKVYLIDEVHMLSKSSFNALLKTLEEPPPHVKFLLATTEPHKLPITVLSRCLQFNLLRLTTVQLEQHLAMILTAEALAFEPGGLALIAKAADGSARDALSLLDQAIAYCAGNITQAAVQTMLGLVSPQQVQAVLTTLQSGQSPALKALLLDLAATGVDYMALLNQLLASFHQLAQTQFLGEALDSGDLTSAQLQEWSAAIDPARLQVWYQIGLRAQQDIRLAPDVRMGFEMMLMRMFAFKPSDGSSRPAISNSAASVTNAPSIDTVMSSNPVATQPPLVPAAAEASAPVQQHQVRETPPSLELDAFPALKARVARVQKRQNASPELNSESVTTVQEQQPAVPEPTIPELVPPPLAEPAPTEVASIEPMLTESSIEQTAAAGVGLPVADLDSWIAMIDQLQPTGMALALAQQACWVKREEQAWWLALDSMQLQANNEVAWQNLQKLVWEKISPDITLHKLSEPLTGLTPAQAMKDQKQQQEQLWMEALEQSTVLANIEAQLGMTRLHNSLKVSY